MKQTFELIETVTYTHAFDVNTTEEKLDEFLESLDTRSADKDLVAMALEREFGSDNVTFLECVFPETELEIC